MVEGTEAAKAGTWKNPKIVRMESLVCEEWGHRAPHFTFSGIPPSLLLLLWSFVWCTSCTWSPAYRSCLGSRLAWQPEVPQGGQVIMVSLPPASRKSVGQGQRQSWREMGRKATGCGHLVAASHLPLSQG